LTITIPYEIGIGKVTATAGFVATMPWEFGITADLSGAIPSLSTDLHHSAIVYTDKTFQVDGEVEAFASVGLKPDIDVSLWELFHIHIVGTAFAEANSKFEASTGNFKNAASTASIGYTAAQGKKFIDEFDVKVNEATCAGPHLVEGYIAAGFKEIGVELGVGVNFWGLKAELKKGFYIPESALPNTKIVGACFFKRGFFFLETAQSVNPQPALPTPQQSFRARSAAKAALEPIVQEEVESEAEAETDEE